MEQAQDQAQTWLLKSHFQVTMNSLRESSFAEDAGGWPPRSYTCSFCRREFRSAQALGGHMNVHRRDRAKLKQSHSPDNENPNHLKSSGLKLPHRPHRTYAASRVSALSATYSIMGGQHEGKLFRSDSTTKPTRSISTCYDGEEINYKRRKIAVSALPFLVVGVKPAVAAGSMEDLDLELRL